MFDIVHKEVWILWIVNIKYNRSEMADSQNTSQLGQQIAEDIENRLGLYSCGNCSLTVRKSSIDREAIDVLVLLKKQLTPSCQLDLIHKGVRAVSGKKMSIRLTPGILLMVYAKIATKRDYDDILIGSEVIYYRQEEFCHGKTPFHITEPVCPLITLTYLESIKLEHENKKNAFLTFFEDVEHRNESTTVHVCTEDYIAAMRQSSGTSSSTQLQFVARLVNLTTLLTYLLCICI